MADSDRSTDGLELKDLHEEIARRKLLLGAIGLGGGSILLTQSDSTRKEETGNLAQAETRLVEVAGRINDADLVDPREVSILHNEIIQAVGSVTETLEHHDSGGPQTEQRVSALDAAIGYYNTLATTLNTGMTLSTQVADSELEVLYHRRGLEYDPVTAFDLEAFKESITQLAQVKKNPEVVSSKGRKLVPDQHQVLNSLRAQCDVFDQHLTAQQTYLDTATTIESGIRAHEQSQFATARSHLSEARESLSAGIPQTRVFYHLSDVGLSLDQYAILLGLRREGVSKLLSVCDESIPKQQRRAVANTALDHFFEARRVTAN